MNITLQDLNPTEIDELFERSIIDIGIPPCPAILKRFMVEAERTELNYAYLADIIETDVAISASLIKTANSPFFGMRQRVRSVKEALALLGLKTSSRAVAGIVLRNSFPSMQSLDRFWDASARIASLSFWLAQHNAIPGLLAEDAYTYGLFRDCGIAVLIKRFPHYHEVLGAANREAEHSFIEVEETVLPTNHAMVGCILAQSWWLPEEIFLAIRNHHELEALNKITSDIPLLSRQLIATAQLAEHIVQHLLGLSFTQEWSKLGNSCLKLLDIDQVQLEAIYDEAARMLALDE